MRVFEKAAFEAFLLTARRGAHYPGKQPNASVEQGNRGRLAPRQDIVADRDRHDRPRLEQPLVLRLYAEPRSVTDMRARKQQEMAAIAANARDYEKKEGVRSGYDEWFEAGLNNAHLVSVATYFDCVPGFERLLEQQGGNLPAYYAQVRALARGPAAARRALCARPGAA